MKLAVKIGKWLLIIGFVLYYFSCSYLYFQQESILFHPTKLSADYQFDFDVDFEEKDYSRRGWNEIKWSIV